MLVLGIIIVVSILVSAFFSGSETALMATSPANIQRLKEEGNRRARLVGKLHKDKERLISTILLGNNAVNIFASAIATSAAISLFGDSGVAYATIFMTLAVLIFAEILPKTFAIYQPERTALMVSPVMFFLVKLLYPITTILHWFVRLISVLPGMRHTTAAALVSGKEALRGAISLHHEEGSVIKDDKDMLAGILDLAHRDVKEVMIHRTNVFTVSLDQPTSEAVKQILDSNHSRVPIWKESPDNIVGIIHLKELLAALRSHQETLDTLSLEEIASEAWFIPESTLLHQQLQAFRSTRNHLALVVDEYGAWLGVVTLEDILEEIVGHIEDEHDDDTIDIKDLPDGSYRVGGSVTIRDLNRHLNWSLPDEEVVTIAGLVMYKAEIIPEKGQIFHFDGTLFEILEKQNNHITGIRVKAVALSSEEDDDVGEKQ